MDQAGVWARTRPSRRAATRRNVRGVHGRDAATAGAGAGESTRGRTGSGARARTGGAQPTRWWSCGGGRWESAPGGARRGGGDSTADQPPADRWLASVGLGAGHDREGISPDRPASTPFSRLPPLPASGLSPGFPAGTANRESRNGARGAYDGAHAGELLGFSTRTTDRAPCGAQHSRDATLSGMNIPFLDNWRKRHDGVRGRGSPPPSRPTPTAWPSSSPSASCCVSEWGSAGSNSTTARPRWPPSTSCRRAGATIPRSCPGWATTRAVPRDGPGAERPRRGLEHLAQRAARGAARLRAGDRCGRGRAGLGDVGQPRALAGVLGVGRRVVISLQPHKKPYAPFVRVGDEVPFRAG